MKAPSQAAQSKNPLPPLPCQQHVMKKYREYWLRQIQSPSLHPMSRYHSANQHAVFPGEAALSQPSSGARGEPLLHPAPNSPAITKPIRDTEKQCQLALVNSTELSFSVVSFETSGEHFLVRV